MTPAEVVALRRQLERSLTATCVIQRQVTNGTDPYGARLVIGWDDLATVPCRVGVADDVESSAPERTRETARYRAVVPWGTDVTVADRLATITDADGSLVAAGPVAIIGVVASDAHILLTLEQVR